MNEILYQLTQYSDSLHNPHIVWLTENDSGRFNEHLVLAEQRLVDNAFFKEIYQKGIARYCLLHHNGLPVARGAVEPYSEQKWEAADIRTVGEYQGRGFAKEILGFLSQYILECGKIATCRTEEDNTAMQKVIEAIGYKALAL